MNRRIEDANSIMSYITKKLDYKQTSSLDTFRYFAKGVTKQVRICTNTDEVAFLDGHGNLINKEIGTDTNTLNNF